MTLLEDGINLASRRRERVNADPRAEQHVEGQLPSEGVEEAHSADSVPLAERLEAMTIPEIEGAVEAGEFTAEEAADAEATLDSPRVGVLSLAIN